MFQMENIMVHQQKTGLGSIAIHRYIHTYIGTDAYTYTRSPVRMQCLSLDGR